MTDPLTKHITFRIPLDILSDHISAIGDFPYDLGSSSWDGPALFVKGEHSKYINHKNIPNCEQFFPNMTLEKLDAGHWVHAERPVEFVDMVSKFIKQAK